VSYTHVQTVKCGNTIPVAALSALLCAAASPQDPSPDLLKIRQIRAALPGDLSDVSAQIEHIRDTFDVHILRLLNSPSPTAEIDKEIVELIKDGWGQPVSLLRATVNDLTVVVVGYTLLHGMSAIPDGTPIIESFRRVGSSYEIAAHGGESLDQSVVKLEELPSPIPGEIWIFAHGQQSRVMQYHERMAIYSFDGFALKQRWISNVPLKAPSFQISKDALRITYENEQDPGPLPLVTTIALTQSGPLETSTILKN
jgi:hypothetical protein